MPNRYYPIPRPPQGDLLGNPRAKLTIADLPPPYVRLSAPFSYEQRGGGRSVQSPLFGQQYPEIKPKIAGAFSYEQGYGAKSSYPPFPLPLPATKPYYVQLYPDPERKSRSRWKPGYSEIQQPSVKYTKAFDYPEKYGAQSTYPPYPIIVAEEIITKPYIVQLPDSYGLSYGGKFIYPPIPAAPPPPLPPDVKYVKLANLADYGIRDTSGRRNLPRWKLGYADLLPPSVKYVKAVEILQALFKPRAVPAFPDLYPPAITRSLAFDYPQLYGAKLYYPPSPPAPPPEIITKPYAGQLWPELVLRARSRWKPGYSDPTPPAITKKVIAFDLAEKLLETRAYRAYADLYPPSVKKVEASGWMREADYVQRDPDGRRRLPWWTYGYSDFIPPKMVHRIVAFELAQKLLGTRGYVLLAPAPEPGVITFAKATAIEVVQRLLGTRVYSYPPDRYPPSIKYVSAFGYPQLYGGRRVYPIPPDFVPPSGIPPEIHRVIAAERLQALFTSKALPTYLDRLPPQVERVAAFELAQKPQKTHFYVVVADLYPPRVSRVKAHDPVQKPILPTAYVIRADLKPPSVYKSTAIERIEARLGVRFKHFEVTQISATFLTPYEALVGLSTITDLPWEAQSEGGVITNWELSWEALAIGQSTGILPWESLTPVTFTAPSATYESLQDASLTNSLPYEALWIFASAGILPYESLVQIRNTIDTVYEALLGISRTSDLPFEALGGVSSTTLLDWEARGFIITDFGLPYEALQSLSLTGELPLETLLGLALTGVLPWESTSELVPPHYLRAAMSSHYYARLLRHYEARMTTHIATELKKL